MSETMRNGRRDFLRQTAVGAGALWVSALQDFSLRRAYGAPYVGGSPYGPIGPKLDQTTGLPLLQLPEGFSYLSYGWTGDRMSDGIATPNLHDGMAVIVDIGRGRRLFDPSRYDSNEEYVNSHFQWLSEFQQRNSPSNYADEFPRQSREESGRLILVRNHEGALGNPYTNNPAITYRSDGAGGTTNLLFDSRNGRFEHSWSSLAGTVRNCAGAQTPWATWLTAEETTEPGHGWMFEVNPLFGDRTPLTAMGRFSHEAAMVDPATGYIYMTEDTGNCGLYRFVPNYRGRPKLGGRLYMLKIVNRPNFDLGGSFPLGTSWNVEWVRIDEPEATTTPVYEQGRLLGGARFSRLEGAWWGDRVGYFLSTDGGIVGEGQVFKFDPRRRELTLIYESPSAQETENPDNITVTPRGGLLLCEDNASPATPAPNDAERLLGLTLNGEVFTFAKNNISLTTSPNGVVRPGDYRQNEWAGACYSPDGNWLFANIQTPGVTFAITGPWHKGPL